MVRSGIREGCKLGHRIVWFANLTCPDHTKDRMLSPEVAKVIYFGYCRDAMGGDYMKLSI